MKQGSDLIVGGQLILSGPILSDHARAWMYDEDVFFCPSLVREALQVMPNGPITVRINSEGGNPHAGETIRAMLAERSRQGTVTMVVEGLAASAASLVLMGAGRREMSAGSFLMIHNPSSVAFGEAEDLRREADVLDLLARTYAGVYASISGSTVDEALQIMADETWFSAETALSAGFIDAVATYETPLPAAQIILPPPSEDDASDADDEGEDLPIVVTEMRDRHRVLMEKSAALVMARRTAAQKQAVKSANRVPDEPVRVPQAMTATTLEVQMKDQNPAVTPANQTQPSPGDVLTAERQRVKSIREMAAPFVASGRLMQADVDALIDEGVAAEIASARVLKKLEAAEPVMSARGVASIGRDETDTKLEGMIGALMGDTSGPAADYRGLRLRNLAMSLAGPRRGFNDVEAVRNGMRSTQFMAGAHGVSDFSYITTEVMNRSLQRAYDRIGPLWQLVAGTPLSASDFREIYAVRFGGDFTLKKVLGNGEYESATLADQADGLKVERRGRTISLTFEAVVNDDMQAFQRIPGEFAQQARIMENSMVWALIRSNAIMKSDTKALFHADHGNLAGTGGAISVTTVGAARTAMWQQKAYGSKGTDDFLQIVADRLIVPPALETVALQFATATTPASDGNVNPYKNQLTPSVVPHLGAVAGGSDTAWYLIASNLPPVSVAYLEGYAAPTVVTVEGMNPDVVTMNARHIFGAAATEYRGAYRNPGA